MRQKQKRSTNRGRNPPVNSKPRNHSNTSDLIELTPQRKRDLLASVGFLEEDEELPEVQLAGSCRSDDNKSTRCNVDREEYFHEREERRRRKEQMKNGHRIDFDEVDFDYANEGQDEYEQEDDELLDNSDEAECDNYSQCSQHGESSSRNRTCSITSKLLWMLAAVSAFMYIFDGDSESPDNPEEATVSKREYYSYKGYKDGRIPDDDIAQYGGGLWFQNEDFDNTVSADDGTDDTSNDYEIDVKSNMEENIDATFDKHETGVPNEESIWQNLNGYAELSQPYNPEAGDIAFFWHIPKCGGTTLQDLMIHCIGMVGANEVGGAYVKDNEPLQIIQLENGNRYVNVDVTQQNGIQHAHDLGFASSGVADVILSSRFHDVATLFEDNQTNNKGRCFTLLRHPIKRAISMFFYLRDATWEHTYSEIYKEMTIEEYAVSQYAEENWMVRFLTNEMTGVLNDGHLDLAKQILQSKCIVGILEEFSESVKRFDRYFGWDQTEFEGGAVPMSNRGVCEARVMSKPDNAHAHPNFDEGSTVWKKLMEKNELDVKLYEHAVELFHNGQTKLI